MLASENEGAGDWTNYQIEYLETANSSAVPFVKPLQTLQTLQAGARLNKSNIHSAALPTVAGARLIKTWSSSINT